MSAQGTVTWERQGSGHRSNPSLNPAKELFDGVMDPLKFGGMGAEDLVGDNGLNAMADFCARTGQNPPMGQRTKKPMAVSAAKKHIEALCKELRTKFGGQPQFTNMPMFTPDDVNSLKKTFEDHQGRTLMAGSGEDAILRDFCPMPRQHSPRTKSLPLHDFSNTAHLNVARSVDPLSMCKRLLRTTSIVNWLLILVTNNAIGRGGEAKFFSCDKMFWDCHFGVLFFQWFQRKEPKTGPSAFVCDFAHPESCALFAFGCFWALENGLVRPANVPADPGSPLHRQSKFVFQHLHAVVDSSVATNIANIVRSCIDASIKMHCTVKSLRAGAMSVLSWSPNVTHEECIAMGGWSAKASRDWHAWQHPVAVVPPALALAGHPDPRALPCNPSFDTPFVDADPTKAFPIAVYESFMRELFPNDPPEFKQHGKLRPPMKVVATVVMKNHRHMMDNRNHGADHQCVHRMRTAVKNVGLAVDLHEASDKLRHWSKKTLDDIERCNRDDSGTLIRATVSDKPHELSHDVADLSRSGQEEQLTQTQTPQGTNEVKQELTDVKGSVSGTMTESRQLRTMPQNTRITQATPITPSQPPVPPAPPVPQQQQQQQPQEQQQQQEPPPPPPQQPQQPQQQQQQQEEKDEEEEEPRRHGGTPIGFLNRLNNNARPAQAMIRSGGKGVGKAERKVRNTLLALCEDRQCRNLRVNPKLSCVGDLVNTRFMGGDNKNLNKTVAALDLVDCSWTQEERHNSTHQAFPDTAAATQAHIAIDDRVKRTCHAFDNPGDNWKPNSGRSTALTGVGNLIAKRGSEAFKARMMSGLPKWNGDPPTTPTPTIWECAQQQETAIKARARGGA